MSESRDEMLARHARELTELDAPKLARCGCGLLPSIVGDMVYCTCGMRAECNGLSYSINTWNRAMSRPKLGLWVVVTMGGRKLVFNDRPEPHTEAAAAAIMKSDEWTPKVVSGQYFQVPKGHPIDLLTSDMTWESEAREL